MGKMATSQPPSFQKSASHTIGFSKSAQSNETPNKEKQQPPEVLPMSRVEQFNHNQIGHKGSAGVL